MANVSDWSPIEEENVNLDQLSLSNEQGLFWNKIMAALRRKCDEVEAAIATIQGGYRYKGTVQTFDDLPTEGVEVGDVYSVVELGGENFAWTEAGWQSLGSYTADVVHKAGDETIDGEKTFTSPIAGDVTGNAGTADQFSSSKAVTLTGDVTGTASSTAGWIVATTLAASGVEAGTYGPAESVSPAAEESFTVPCFTVDAKGRVTAVVNRIITLPPDTDTTYQAFVGATSLQDGAQGLVPKPYAADVDKVLSAYGWRYLVAADITAGTISLDRIPSLDASRIPNLDASKITTGTIDVARLPAAALERLVVVANQAARYALTTLDVQLGDVVKQSDTGLLYYVVDTAKLNQAAGYVEFTAGSAASVPWSGVTGKPSTFTPSSHAHGNVTNDGKLSTASRAVVTDANKSIAVSSVTAAELGYLSGVTSSVQSQINGKAAVSHSHTGTQVTLSGYSKPSSASAVSASDTATVAVGKLEAGLDSKADKEDLWNWQKTEKAGAVTFKPAIESNLEPVVDFIFTETPPASGDKGPENPSTITGVSSVGVGCLGKNLFFLLQNQTKSGVTCTINEDGSITLDGTASETITFVTYVNSISSILGKSWFSSGSKINCYYEKISGTATVGSSNGFKIQMSCPSRNGTSFYPGATQDVEGVGATWVATDDFRILSSAIQIYQGMSFSNYRIKIQFELDSVHTNFENFIIANYTIQLGDTYYGGSIDVSTGVMTVTFASIVISGTTTYSSSAGVTEGTNFYRLGIYPYPARNNGVIAPYSACNTLPINDGDNFIRLSNNSYKIEVQLQKSLLNLGDGESYSVVQSAFQTFFSAYPTTVVYPVSTLYTVQLTPTQIRSLPALDKYEPRINTVYTDQEAVQVYYQKIANGVKYPLSSQNPERMVLCGDGVWRYFEDIAF